MSSIKGRLERLERLICGPLVVVETIDGGHQEWTPKQIFEVLTICIEACALNIAPYDPEEKTLFDAVLKIADSDKENHKALILARNMALEVIRNEH